MSRDRIRRRLSILAALCAVVMPLLATTGTVEAAGTAVCSGTLVLSFTGYQLTLVPNQAPDSFALSTPTPMTCEGVPGGSLTITGGGSLGPVGSCAGVLVVNGTALLSPPSGGSLSVSFDAIGPAPVQAWAFSGASPIVVAAGPFVWASPKELSGCTSPLGTGTMTLLGAIAVAWNT